MGLEKSFKLASGHWMPSMGFGTFATSTESNSNALKAGMRLLDTAWCYGTEKFVGEAINASNVPRSEIFLTTKLTEWHHSPELAKKGLLDSLDRMGVDYVDLLLIHWPIAYVPTKEARTVDMSQVDQRSNKDAQGQAMFERDSNGKEKIDEELSNNHVSTWKAMEELVDAGKVRSLGLSNFNIPQTDALKPHTRHPICVNQCEAHPWLANNTLFEHCKQNNIILQAYCPLGAGIDLVKDDKIVQLAKSCDLSPQALVLSWAIQRWTCPLTKTNSIDRLKGNMGVKELPRDVFTQLNNMDMKGQIRQNHGHTAMGKVWDEGKSIKVA